METMERKRPAFTPEFKASAACETVRVTPASRASGPTTDTPALCLFQQAAGERHFHILLRGLPGGRFAAAFLDLSHR